MSLQDLVNVSITAATVSPTRPGFGTPILVGYHTHWTDRFRTYSSLAGMVSDGFLVTEPLYKEAAALLAANPTVVNFIIGRRALAPTQTVKLTLASTSSLDNYTLSMVGTDGTSRNLAFASTGSTYADASSLATSINLHSNVLGVATALSGVVTVTQTAGKLSDYQGWNPSQSQSPIMSLADVTTDPGIATDLANILAATPPGAFYGIALDSNSAAEVEAAAAWTESNGAHIFLFNNSDTVCIGSGSTDVFSFLKNLAYVRTGGLFAGSQLLCYSGAAWFGATLPANPGSLTFMYKTLPGVPADNLTESDQTNLNNKSANYYIPVAGINVTINGVSAGGEFLDITWGTDALQSQIQINVFSLLQSSPKVPYTDLGVDMIVSVVKSALALFTTPQYKFLSTNPAPTVTTVPVANESQANRAARIYPDVTFQAKYAGAIHQVTIKGTISV